MKIFINNAKNWVVDRFIHEWNANNLKQKKVSGKNKIIWIISPWTWNRIPKIF